jgi:hypothetical protein
VTSRIRCGQILKASATGRSGWRGPWAAGQDGRAGEAGGGAVYRARHAFAGRDCFHSEATAAGMRRPGARMMTLHLCLQRAIGGIASFDGLLPASNVSAVRDTTGGLYCGFRPWSRLPLHSPRTTPSAASSASSPSTAVPSTRSAIGTRPRSCATTADNHGQHSPRGVASPVRARLSLAL